MNAIFDYMGEIAGGISFTAYLLYISSTLRGKTKPSRSTWWILTLVGGLILCTSYSMGAKENIWIMASYVFGPLFIAIISLHPKYGYGEKLLGIDIACLTSAGVCAVLWLVFNSPLIAFLGSILIDAIGLVPTIKKAYAEPKKEDPLAWSMEMVASVLNAIGISVWFTNADLNWVYALYMLLVNGIVLSLLLGRLPSNKRRHISL